MAMRAFSSSLLLPALVASIVLCVIRVMAINVSIPDEFVQCEPATINLTNSRGNVSILIRKAGTKKAHVNISLAENVSSWTWDPVDLPAMDNFTILVTDRSPKKKTKLSQSLYASSVDPSANDTCLPAQSKGHHRGNGGGGGANDGDDDGLGDDMGDNGDHHRSKRSTTEVAIIAGVLGGVLFTLLALTVFMCLRRRREHKGLNAGSANLTDDDGRPIVAQRIRDMQNISGPHRVVTLYGPDGRAEGQAVLSREGDAGWTYMSRMVPGLETSPDATATGSNATISGPLFPSGRRRPLATKRYDEEAKDGDLPSYGMSEYERKNLPKYEGGAARGQQEPLVLSTRRDSQGSRLTFFAPEAQEMLHDRPQITSRGASQASGLDGYIRRSVSSRRSQLDVPSARRHNIDMGAHDGSGDDYGEGGGEDEESNGVIVFGNEHDSYIASPPGTRSGYTLHDPPVGGQRSTETHQARRNAPTRTYHQDGGSGGPSASVATNSLHGSDDSALSGYARMLAEGESSPYTSAISPASQGAPSTTALPAAFAGQGYGHMRRGSHRQASSAPRNPFI